MDPETNIVLIGMPGAGKSTLGVLLAKELSRSFLDTDILIQTREGRTLQSILEEYGVAHFLRLEESLVLSLRPEGHVIATIRSKTAWEHQEDERGRKQPVRIGLVPEQGKGIEYEFDLLLQMSTDHAATVIKDRTGKYQDKALDLPDEDFGRELAAWLGQGAPPAPRTSADLTRLNELIAELAVPAQTQRAWCDHFKVERLDQLAQSQVDAIIRKVESATGR